MGYPNSTDNYGAHYDNQGTNYKTSSDQPAVHGQIVDVNDGYGNFKPGFMNNGTAVPTKKD